MFLDWSYPVRHIGELVSGALLTLGISLMCFICSFILGLLCSLVRFSKRPRSLYPIVSVFVEIFRNTPLLVQLFFAYFGLPKLGIYLTPLASGLIILSLNSASYYSEIMRGGIQSIPVGQWEAAQTLNISKASAMIHIIFPQAIRDVFPSIANQLVLLIFGTSVLSILDVRELTQVASVLNSRSFRSMELYTFVMLFYYGITALTLSIAKLAYKKWFTTKPEAESEVK